MNRQFHRRRWRWQLLGLLLAGVVQAEQEVPLQVEETAHHYVVDAVDGAVLWAQVDAGKPRTRAGRASHGMLVVDLAAHYRLQAVSGGCRLDASAVTLSLDLWLPRWMPAGDPAGALRDAWDTMLAGLSEHERGHREHALAAAEAFAKRIAALPPIAVDCRSLRRTLLGLRLSVMAELALRDAAYDRRTGHGLQQGAALILPPPAALPFCARRETALRRNCRSVR